VGFVNRDGKTLQSNSGADSNVGFRVVPPRVQRQDQRQTVSRMYPPHAFQLLFAFFSEEGKFLLDTPLVEIRPSATMVASIVESAKLHGCLVQIVLTIEVLLCLP